MSARYRDVKACRATLLQMLAILAVLTPTGAQAGTIKCDGEVQAVLIYARGQAEGQVVLKLKRDTGVGYWPICNLNEDKIVGGVATSKNGVPLMAAQDSYSTTCGALLNAAHIAKATGKKLRLSFLDTTFATCDDVPVWNGIAGGDNDDPGGRLGAWDGLYYVEVLVSDVTSP